MKSQVSPNKHQVGSSEVAHESLAPMFYLLERFSGFVVFFLFDREL